MVFAPYLASPIWRRLAASLLLQGLLFFPSLCVLVLVDSCMYIWFSLAVSGSGLVFLGHVDFLVLEGNRLGVRSIFTRVEPCSAQVVNTGFLNVAITPHHVSSRRFFFPLLFSSSVSFATACCSPSCFQHAIQPRPARRCLHHHSFTLSTSDLPSRISVWWFIFGGGTKGEPSRLCARLESILQVVCAPWRVFAGTGNTEGRTTFATL